MSRNNFLAPKLPKALRDEVEAGSSSGSGRRKKSLPRKEQRKLERQQKKQHVRRPQVGQDSFNRIERHHSGNDEEEDIADPWGGDESADEDDLPLPARKRVKISPPEQRIQEKHVALQAKAVESEKPPRPSRAVRDALEDDDAEIAFLEKKLGIRGKKRAKTGGSDDLDGLLAGIDEAVTGESQRQRSEDKAWLEAKRRTAHTDEEALDDQISDLDELDYESDQSDEVLDSSEEPLFGDEDEDEEDEDGSEDDVSTNSNIEHSAPVRENPYRPPIPTTQASTQKYVPPSLREPAKDDVELLQRLRRQLQGLLNRLSESNILSIVKEVESVVANNARQHVISTIIDLLIVLIVDRTNHLDTFIVLHAALITALYGSLGTHFGAQILERLIKEFRHHYDQQLQSPSGSKEASNIIALLAEMYSFQVIGATLMFDIVRFLLADLSDLNTELLLKLIKNCGGQLRADDPMALKDIVLLLQKAVAKKGGESQLPVRTRFMVETISNLKNNRLKSGPAGMDITSEHALRLKKMIKSSRKRAVEPLGVGLKDIDNAAEGGKWWLVGASWNNGVNTNARDASPRPDMSNEEDEEEDYFADDGATGASDDLLELAKQHRMNTDARRSIFVTLMSSVDYKDAWLRLRRLRLSKTQQFEIPRVIVYLAGAEDKYNPFYRLVAKKFCSEHKYRKALQFNLWRIWRRCGEKGGLDDEDNGEDADEQDTETIDLREIASLARFYGELIADQSLSITILKTLDYMYLQEKTQAFAEVLLVTVYQSIDRQSKSQPGVTAAKTFDIFTVAKQAPQMTPGLSYFLKSRVKRTSLISGSTERKSLASWCRTAISAMALAEYSGQDL